MKVIPVSTKPGSISLRGFYERQPTALLKAIRNGFEADFDKSSAGQAEYPSTDWLSTRMHLIDTILEKGIDEAPQQAPVQFSPANPKNRTR